MTIASPTAAIAKRLLEEGRAAEAAELLRGATDLDGLVILSEASAITGDVDGARDACQRAVRLDPAAPGLFERWMRLRAVTDPSAATSLSLSRTLPTRAPTGLTLLGEAGRGGTAVVYQAEDGALGRSVAIKVYHRPREQRAQLAREVEVALDVAGSGVTRVFDASADEGWLQLEWAPRGSLAQRVPAGDAWVDQLIRALARVHRRGWVHGDLKPANVLFDAVGAPLLSDFGLASRPGDPYRGGTPGFLSPERSRGDGAALADDVYALGKTLAVALPDSASGRVRSLVAEMLADSRPASALAFF